MRLIILSFLAVWLITSAQMCRQVIVHGKDYYTEPYSRVYSTNQETVLDALQQTLKNAGYKIHYVDSGQGKVVTGWQAVEADSHYFDMFGRKDYGASDGAYYQLILDFLPVDPKVKVAASTRVKTIVGRLHSTGKVEKRLLKKLADFLRSSQIEMTNVGVERK